MLAIDGGELSASRSGRVTPGIEPPLPTVGLDAVVKRKIPSPWRESIVVVLPAAQSLHWLSYTGSSSVQNREIILTEHEENQEKVERTFQRQPVRIPAVLLVVVTGYPSTWNRLQLFWSISLSDWTIIRFHFFLKGGNNFQNLSEWMTGILLEFLLYLMLFSWKESRH